MEAPREETWLEWNQSCLSAALLRVRSLLEIHAAGSHAPAPDTVIVQEHQAVPAGGMHGPSALETISAVFALSEFERDVLVMCAGMELESTFPPLVARAHGDSSRDRPDFSLALAAFPQAHWSALSPGAPLRHWRLIEVDAGSAVVTSPLRIDERVLHYLTGVQHLDERLLGIVRPLKTGDVDRLVPSHASVAERIASAWSRRIDTGCLPAVQLSGREESGKRAVAASAAGRLGLSLHEMSAHALPTAPSDLDTLIRLWRREAALSRSSLFLDCHDADPADRVREETIRRFIENVGGVLLIGSLEPRRSCHCPLISYELDKPTSREQRALWEEALGPAATSMNGLVTRLVSQFHLDQPAILAACNRATWGAAACRTAGPGSAELAGELWQACRVQVRPRMEDLAQRIEPVAGWEDLVLAEAPMNTLRNIAAHVRHRATVYDAWGFGAKSNRGLGISALFSGPSGTGKTMAAEVLANELDLDLYRIDLSQVVSKYIGETEKNLRRVFDAAESGGAILLFDEADALFGKRSEVKDSHDRYANIEVSYLLQRMESYRGLAILTTNMKSALDDAFLRRIRFVIQFPFPDRAQRAAIWERIYPPETPTEGLDWFRLAQLNVAGGNIRNIALNAAFLAADADCPVRMEHLLEAARLEYSKLEKPLTPGETRGWEPS